MEHSTGAERANLARVARPTGSGYPLETVVAEKIEAIIQLGLLSTNITLDLALGGDLKTASQRAGYASIQITANTYQHPDVAQHLKATTRLANLLTPQRGNEPLRIA